MLHSINLILDSKRSVFWDSRFLDLDTGFQKVGFQIPQANVSWILGDLTWGKTEIIKINAMIMGLYIIIILGLLLQYFHALATKSPTLQYEMLLVRKEKPEAKPKFVIKANSC